MRGIFKEYKSVESEYGQEKLSHNPLIHGIERIYSRFSDFKEQVKAFYFDVVLITCKCPKCEERLKMIGQSKCACPCGNSFDPTLVFQKSTCCNTNLIRKTFHYTCSRCHRIIPSRFLFDEKLFDKTYFREMMQESRKKAKKKKEEIRRLLDESRSDTLYLMESPDFESIPGLSQDLNDFVQQNSAETCGFSFEMKSDFYMNDYRNHILSTLGWSRMHFSDIGSLIDDYHLDRVRRFITLIFMQNDNKVELTQQGEDLFVQKVYNEAYN